MRSPIYRRTGRHQSMRLKDGCACRKKLSEGAWGQALDVFKNIAAAPSCEGSSRPTAASFSIRQF